MKLQRYINSAVNADYAGNYDILADDGPVCLASDVEALEAENAALHAECDRLTAMLGPQRVLSAEEVTEPGFYQWRHMDGEQWTVTEVVVNEAPELRQYYIATDEDEELNGEFIGPISMPEV